MLRLPDVTLILIAGSYTALADAALRDTLAVCEPAEVVVFGNDPPAAGRHVPTAIGSNDDAGLLVMKGLAEHVGTSHAMLIHWDGHPINPDLWTPAFLEYDYIGAPWPWYRDRAVGNGGFSLRSRRLIDALADRTLFYTDPEDVTICRTFGAALEERHGIRFAPPELAWQFSIEHGPLDARAFGYHGLWHWLGRLPREELRRRLGLLSPGQWANAQIEILAYRALLTGRMDDYRWAVEERQRVAMNQQLIATS